MLVDKKEGNGTLWAAVDFVTLVQHWFSLEKDTVTRTWLKMFDWATPSKRLAHMSLLTYVLYKATMGIQESLNGDLTYVIISN
jgi:hypothetical protein